MRTGKPKILIIDDSKNIRKLVTVVLRDKDYDFVEASNGLEALDKVKIENPDLVVLDIVIPGVNGIEVCKAIKSDPKTKHVHVIILTSESTLEARELSHQAGADVFMLKPFEPKDLRNAVKELLSGRLDDCMQNIEKIWTTIYNDN
jgi:twitching motility two-component system response regulator PilH